MRLARRTTPVAPMVGEDRRRRWYHWPNLGGMLLPWCRRRAARTAADAPHILTADDPLDQLPEDTNTWPDFFLETLLVPLTGHVDGSDRNMIINLRKAILFNIVPQGQPRHLQVAMTDGGATVVGGQVVQRSASEPTLFLSQPSKVKAYMTACGTAVGDSKVQRSASEPNLLAGE